MSRVKEKDDDNYKYDLLVITTEEDTQENDITKFMKKIEKKSEENKMLTEIIQRPQIVTEYSDYFLVFRMKMLIVVKKDRNTDKIIMECKFRDQKKIISNDQLDFNIVKELINSVDNFKKKYNKK